MSKVVRMTPGQWRAWAERRLLHADAYVERLRVEARDAVLLAASEECEECEIALCVPVDGEHYAFHRAHVMHELGCPVASGAD